MGSGFSQNISEAKENGGQDLVIDQKDKIQAKEIEQLIQLLEEELPQLSSLTVSGCKVIFPEDLGHLLSKLKHLTSLKLQVTCALSFGSI